MIVTDEKILRQRSEEWHNDETRLGRLFKLS